MYDYNMANLDVLKKTVNPGSLDDIMASNLSNRECSKLDNNNGKCQDPPLKPY